MKIIWVTTSLEAGLKGTLKVPIPRILCEVRISHPGLSEKKCQKEGSLQGIGDRQHPSQMKERESKDILMCSVLGHFKEKRKQ